MLAICWGTFVICDLFHQDVVIKRMTVSWLLWSNNLPMNTMPSMHAVKHMQKTLLVCSLTRNNVCTLLHTHTAWLLGNDLPSLKAIFLSWWYKDSGIIFFFSNLRMDAFKKSCVSFQSCFEYHSFSWRTASGHISEEILFMCYAQAELTSLLLIFSHPPWSPCCKNPIMKWENGRQPPTRETSAHLGVNPVTQNGHR